MDDLISRQAAIDALKNRWKKTRNYEGIGDDIAEECELYLKQLPSVQPEIKERTKEFAQNVPKEDLISRKAAIEAMSESLKRVFPEHRQIAEKCLKALPSVQPEPCEDAVSRKAVYDAMVEKGQRSRRYKLGEIWELNGTEIREALDTVPSVTPKQKAGKAVVKSDGGKGFWVCNQCGERVHTWDKYCSECGAKMI